MPNMGILTEEAIRDSGEKFKEVTGTDLPGNKRGLDVAINATGMQAGSYGAISVTATQVSASVSGTPLTNRVVLIVRPTDGDIYWGFTNAVTTSTGMPIVSGQTARFSVADDQEIYLVSGGTVDVRIVEGLA